MNLEILEFPSERTESRKQYGSQFAFPSGGLELLSDGFVGPAEAHACLQHRVWELCWPISASEPLGTDPSCLVGLGEDPNTEHLGNIVSTVLLKLCSLG